MRLHSVNALVNQRAARRRTVGRARLGCNLGNGTAQDLDLSGGAAVPAQRLQPHKPSHRRGEETVENPEVSVCVGPEDLETTDTKLTVDHGKRLRKLNPRRVVGGGANLLLFGQNILVRLPVFSVFAEINSVGLDVALGRAGCYYT